MNVVMKEEGMVIAQQGNGNYFVLGEPLLAADNVVIYNWFDGKSPAYYQGITGDVHALLFVCCASDTNTGFNGSRPSTRVASHSAYKV